MHGSCLSLRYRHRSGYCCHALMPFLNLHYANLHAVSVRWQLRVAFLNHKFLLIHYLNDIFIFVPSNAKVSQRISELQTWTVGSTLGWSQMLTDGRMNRQNTGSLYRAMPEAGMTKMLPVLALV